MSARDHHAARDLGARKAPEGYPALRWGSGARLELSARAPAIERADGDEDAHQVLLRHRSQEVEVALDERRLGHDAHRVVALGEHLEDLAGDLVLALDRLVAVGVGAERDAGGLVAGLG